MATPDDPLAALRGRQPPWDDLLERRVLNEVHAEHGRRGERARRGRGWASVATVAMVVVGVGVWGIGSFDRAAPASGQASGVADGSVVGPAAVGPSVDGGNEPVELGPTIAGPMAPAEDESSVMALADGSRAVLDDGARLDVLLQTPERIDLAHREGRVRYEIEPDPLRSFVVRAGAYEVRVLGTVFVIEATIERVRVEVERGKVAVTDEGRVLELGVGERIDLPRREAAEAGREAAEAGREAVPTKPAPRPPRSSVDDLLARADAARRSGRAEDAAAALTQLVREHPRDPRAASAWFMLGRVQRGLGRHAEAARAFQGAWKADPGPALAEDARAEEALSWHDAGSTDRAVHAADAYLARYPAGTHVARIRTIIER
jgi:transmembrane sensor